MNLKALENETRDIFFEFIKDMSDDFEGTREYSNNATYVEMEYEVVEDLAGLGGDTDSVKDDHILMEHIFNGLKILHNVDKLIGGTHE